MSTASHWLSLMLSTVGRKILFTSKQHFKGFFFLKKCTQGNSHCAKHIIRNTVFPLRWFVAGGDLDREVLWEARKLTLYNLIAHNTADTFMGEF